MSVTVADTIDIRVPAEVAARIDSIAAARHVSRDRAVRDLLRDAIAAYDERRAAFLELADRFRRSTDPAETDRLRGELAQMTGQ